MRRRSLVLALAAASLAAVPALAGVAAADKPELAPGTHPGASNGVVYQYARGQAPARGGTSRVLMTNHGGNVMSTSYTHTIFWGTSWPGYTGDKITGLESWYSGFGGSNYAKTTTEYKGVNGQPVGASSTYLGKTIDGTAASGGQNTSAILAEVQRVVTSQGITPNPNDYYAVYTDLPRGNAGYCAWHSNGTVNSVPVQFAFFWKLDGDAGCDPQSTVPGESQGLAALANVTGHELAEAMTDPALNAWYDGSGAENGDKCAWSFNVPSVTFSNGTQWKIQGEWSNAAYNAGTGYPNNSGQRGCLDGH